MMIMVNKMSIKFIAIDVETPNRFNNRISSIGITTITDRGEVSTQEILVNPECDFDERNISLTGITPEMVETAPTFADVWNDISPLFNGAIVVAHNAQFDLCVLRKTLSAYNIMAPQIPYICTLEVSQKHLPALENHKLPTLCDYYLLPLEHHHSGSDSEACARILIQMIIDGIDVSRYIHYYDLGEPIEECGHSFRHRNESENTRALNEMNEILRDISDDGVLTEDEINYLIDWMNDNQALRGNYPYDRVFHKLSEVLQDGIITIEEQNELIQLFQTMINPVDAVECPCSVISIEGKNICLSGEFDYGSIDTVASMLEGKGALIQKGVTQKTNMLIVGGQGSSAWSSGNYGTKIKKALELQAKGIDVLIIREADLFNAIEV